MLVQIVGGDSEETRSTIMPGNLNVLKICVLFFLFLQLPSALDNLFLVESLNSDQESQVTLLLLYWSHKS